MHFNNVTFTITKEYALKQSEEQKLFFINILSYYKDVFFGQL